jgi:molybdopterin-containing oxidoreductase family membrane subunit
MVLTLAIPLRHFFRLEDFITLRHLDNAAKILLACGWIVAYGYFIETFTAFYSGDPFEIAMVKDRFSGFYGPVYWTVLACNVVIPQILWWPAARRSVWALFAVSLVVNLGMWLERVMIVVQSMHHDFLPSAWGNFIPSIWDWITLLGSIAFFLFLFLLFVRFLPAISIFEMRELVREEKARVRS